MKGWYWHLAVEAVAGALGVSAIASLPMPESTREPALWGVVVATAVGLVALAFKAQQAADVARGQRPYETLTALLRVQGVSFGLRLLGVATGAVVLKAVGLEPLPYVLAFFAVYLVQQVVEVRLILAAQPGSGHEVSR